MGCSYTAIPVWSGHIMIFAQCDADGDGKQAVYRIEHPNMKAPAPMTEDTVY